MWNVITIDGHFEGESDWELSFHMDCRRKSNQNMNKEIM